MRLVLAYLTAPLATPVFIAAVFMVAFLLQIGWFRNKSLGLVASNVLTYGAVALPLAYAAAVILGIPAYLVMRHKRAVTLSVAVATGVVVAVAPLFAWFVYVIAAEGISALSAVYDAAWWTFLFAGSGASSGALFWFIGLRPAVAGSATPRSS